MFSHLILPMLIWLEPGHMYCTDERVANICSCIGHRENQSRTQTLGCLTRMPDEMKGFDLISFDMRGRQWENVRPALEGNDKFKCPCPPE